MGLGSLNDLTDMEEPNKSLHWSLEFPWIRYLSSTISFLFFDLYIVASLPWSSEALHTFEGTKFNPMQFYITKCDKTQVYPSMAYRIK